MRFAKLVPMIGIVGILAMACGGSTSTGTTAATVPSDLSISSFDANFTYMSKLTDLTKAGKGLVGVILPETSTSARYVDYDQPYLTKAFTAAGYTSSQFKIDNAQGSVQSEVAIAQADITAGATVLLMDPADGPTGQQIQSLAAAKGVKVISYDRATFQGTNTYYVSFDNVQVGKLIGKGFMDCVTAWNIKNPKVFTLNGGEDTDPNAFSFAQGYNQVIWGDTTTPEPKGKTNSAGYTLVGDQVAPGWDNAKGAAIFQAAFAVNKDINATVEANDGLGNAVIQVLKNSGVKANTIPTTGQDATLQGMANVLQGFQCGSVYKPIYLEAQAAVALATVLRAGATPPAALVNGTTKPPSGQSGSEEPATLLVPIWVDKSNMAATVIKDQFVKASALCGQVGAAVCTANNIPTS
jgi:D-xylose transport system substrate-binding protein